MGLFSSFVLLFVSFVPYHRGIFRAKNEGSASGIVTLSSSAIRSAYGGVMKDEKKVVKDDDESR